MDKLAQFKTETLFLLIGTNPLPNYVAARLLVKEGGSIYLLSSGGARGTGRIAENLQTVLQDSLPGVKCVCHEIDESDGSKIRQKIGEILRDVPLTSIGLHFTGGTKAMAVHAYRTIEQAAPGAIFSYLDARTLSLVIEQPAGTTARRIFVGDDCEVTLDQLSRLHDRVVRQEIEREPRLPKVAGKLLNLHATPEKWKAWRKWIQENLRCENQPDKPKSAGALKKVLIPHEDAILGTVFAELRSAKTLADISDAPDWDVENVAEWLHGKWLEHYVLDCVRQLANEVKLHDWGMGVQPKRGTNPEFDIDVAAMRGYQLFAISCTTDGKRSMCKSKFFEVYVRARQMGGDEARVALVCFYKDPVGLQREIEENWFVEGKVRVFGPPHFSCLTDHLRDWFETANEPDE